MTGSFTMTVSDLMNGDYNADVKVIGLDGYPIFDEQHRKILNDKIVMRYWTREIGVETDSLFRHHMRRTMNEIMPQFNQLYESTRIEFDPMSTIDIQSLVDSESLNDIVSNSTSNSETTANSNTENSSNTNAKSRAVASEMPQTQLAGNQDYATSATDSLSDSDSTGTASGSEQTQGTGTESGSQTAVGSGKVVSSTTGRQAPGAALIQAYRDQIINVDVMVLDSLEPLFMQLWTNHDSYSERGDNGLMFYQYRFF